MARTGQQWHVPENFDESQPMDHGGDFRKYMVNKIYKLNKQFAHQRVESQPASADPLKTLFAGVSIHVNGHTHPSQLELKELMANYGGGYQEYCSRERVTHIICSNLPAAKVKLYMKARDPLPIVLPEWVTDSIKAGTKLPLREYSLHQLTVKPGQRSLDAFAQPSSEKPSLAAPGACGHAPPLSAEGTAASPAGNKVEEGGQDTVPAAAALGSAWSKWYDEDAPGEVPVRGPPVVQRAPVLREGVPSETAESVTALQALLRSRAALDQPADPPFAAGTGDPAVAAGGVLLRPTIEQDEAGETQGQQHHGCDRQHKCDELSLGQSSPGLPFAQLPAMDGGQPSAVPDGGAISLPAGRASRSGDSSGPSSQDAPPPVLQSQPAQEQRPTAHKPQAQQQPPQRCHGDPWLPPYRQQPEPTLHTHPGEQANTSPDAGADVEAGKGGGNLRSPTRPGWTEADAADRHTAEQVAAQARAACDVLKGAPKSSREDPDFMNTFFRASRLHFIGTWKSRLEEIMARNAASGPAPIKPSAVGGFAARRGAYIEPAIIHIDMDCFFASVAEIRNPSCKGKPMAVCHSASSRGTGEVSSANYPAREFGICAGMMIGEAKRRCPSLIVMPYDFDAYAEVSEKVYAILLRQTSCVSPVSCDEAYLDVTGLGNPEVIADDIRAKVFSETQCTASAGIGPNMILARMATKRGKPNGKFRILPQEAQTYLADLPVSELPGVGWSLQKRLSVLGIECVQDIRGKFTLSALQHELGSKTGSKLWSFSLGQDDREVEPPKARKSVGAEVNWGIRFTCAADADKFADEVAAEVSRRLAAAGARGRTITLKLFEAGGVRFPVVQLTPLHMPHVQIMRRKAGAPEPWKFLGHGPCDNMSRSVTLPRFTDDARAIGHEAKLLLKALRLPAPDIRGIGITVTKLDSDPASAASRPSAPAPAKAAAPPPSLYQPGKERWVEKPSFLDGTGKVTSGEHPTAVSPGEAGASAWPGLHGGGDAAAVSGRAERDEVPRGSWSEVGAPAPHQGGTLTRDAGAEEAAVLVEGRGVHGWQENPPAVAADSDPAAVARPLQGSCVGGGTSGIPAGWDGIPATEDLDAPAGIDGAIGECASPADAGISEPEQQQQDQPGLPGAVHSADDSAAGQTMQHRGQDQGRQPQQAAAHPPISCKGLVGRGQPERQVLPPKSMPPSARPGGGMPAAVHWQMLPSASQIDASVMDALPLDVRQELEVAMGLRKSPAKRQRVGGRGRGAKRQRADALEPLHPVKLARRAAASRIRCAPEQLSASGRVLPSILSGLYRLVHSRHDLTFSQMDPAVLAELPRELQEELVAHLPTSLRPSTVGAHRGKQRDSAHLGSAPQEHCAPLLDLQQPLPALLQPAIQAMNDGLPASSVWPRVENAISSLLDSHASCNAHPDADCRTREISLGSGVNSKPADCAVAIEPTADAPSRSSPAAAAQLALLAECVAKWTCSIAGRDLETVQWLLRRVQRRAASQPAFARAADNIICAVRERVVAQYGGFVRLMNVFDKIS